MKAEKKLEPIKIKKLNIRGDEIAILFFSLLFLFFLIISFFRLFALGKLFDDFIFILLFGWTKYLVYLILFAITIPICFNYYFKVRISFIFATIFSLIGISWLVSNVNLIIINDQNIWLKFVPYNFTSFENYLDNWWVSTIINNYYGFFAHPISFNDWTSVSSFFPKFATGGIISNFLIMTTNYGSFTTNLILNFLFLTVSLNWLIFNKPWFFFAIIFFFTKPIITFFRKKSERKKIAKISQRSIEQEQVAIRNNVRIQSQEQLENQKNLNQNIHDNNLMPNNNGDFNEAFNSGLTFNNDQFDQTKQKNDKQQVLIQNTLRESGTLTPFGQVQRDPTQKLDFVDIEQN